jgi:hypothetical protein
MFAPEGRTLRPHMVEWEDAFSQARQRMSEWEISLPLGVTAELLSSISSYLNSLEHKQFDDPRHEKVHTGKVRVDTEKRLGTATVRSFKRVVTSQ